MKLRYKIAGGFVGVLALAITTLAIVIGRTDDCPAPPVLATDAELMQAVVARCYGSPEILQVEQVEKPQPADDQILVKIKAASVNPLDWHYMRGSPYLMRLVSGLGLPDDPRTGVDFAGVVEAVGKNVSKFAVGDEVFGGANGAFAEYLAVRETGAVAAKPANVTFAEAAAVPIAGITALQAVRDEAALQAGQKVLINGASGGVGTYAVQIAKAMGAEVAGVCSTRNVEMVQSLGADRVYDYKKENYTEDSVIFDAIIDNVGNHSLSRNRDVLKDDGRLVLVGGSKGDWVGPLSGPVRALLLSPFVDQQIGSMLAQMRQADLVEFAGLLASGQVRSVIDRSYTLDEVPAAIAYSESGRARGKIVITMGD